MVIGIIVLAVKMYLKTEEGRLNFDTMIMKMPIVKPVVVKTITVRFCRTFAMLFSSGMPMLQSLNIVGRVVNNASIKSSMNGMSDDIRKGISLSQAIQKVPAFPPMVQSMISIGEESGSLDQMLENAAAYFEDELETDLNKMVSLVEPIMIIIMGVIIAFVILAIMLPMLQIYQNAG
jgi:type IV pilus assembly protein PilC